MGFSGGGGLAPNYTVDGNNQNVPVSGETSMMVIGPLNPGPSGHILLICFVTYLAGTTTTQIRLRIRKGATALAAQTGTEVDDSGTLACTTGLLMTVSLMCQDPTDEGGSATPGTYYSAGLTPQNGSGAGTCQNIAFLAIPY